MLEAWRSWALILANNKNKSNTELKYSARRKGGQATSIAFTLGIFITGLPRMFAILVEDLLCSALLIFLGNSFRDSPRHWPLSLFQIQAIKINSTLNIVANIETCMSAACQVIFLSILKICTSPQNLLYGSLFTSSWQPRCWLWD